LWKKERAVDAPDAVARLLESVDARGIDAVGHRIVNGGKSFAEASRITPEVKSALADLARAARRFPRSRCSTARSIRLFHRRLTRIPALPRCSTKPSGGLDFTASATATFRGAPHGC
jgi:acetate kinase